MAKNLHVLIVEDRPADAELMVMRLKNNGFDFDWQRVQTETDYLTALDKNPDLVLSDWSLPQFSGLRALKLTRNRGLEIPFIIVSGSIGEEAAIEALRQGADDYILKDRPDRLGQAIQNALQQKKLRDERKQAMEALIWEQYLVDTLMDTVPDAIYFKDTQSRFIRINQYQARKFELDDPKKVIGKTDFDFFRTDHAQAAYEDEQNIIRTGQPIINIEELETYPGRLSKWVSTTKMALRDQNGDIVGTFGISRDITERKRAEEALRDSNERYRKLVEESHELIFTHDLELNILSMNPAMQNLLETPDSVRDLNLYNIVPINKHNEFVPYIQAISRDGITSGNWTILTQKNDERILEYQSTLIDQQAHAPIVRCMAQDTTDKIHREQELEAIAAMSRALRSFAPNQEILPIILQEINKLVKVDGSAISLVHEDIGKLSVDLGFGDWVHWTGTMLPLETRVYGVVCDTGQPFVDDKAAYRNVSDWPGTLGDIHKVVCVPLIANDQMLGALWLGRKETFSKRDVRILTTLSDISANAIRNAALYKQEKNRVATLASLYDAGLALNSLLEPHAQLEFLLKIAMDELHAERMVFLRYIPMDSCYVADHCLGFQEEVQAGIYHNRYPSDEAHDSPGWIKMDELPINNPDIAGNVIFSLGDSEVHSVLWVPVQHGDHIRGILGAMSTKSYAFNHDQERLLVLFANQAAVAMEHAGLLSETKLQVQRLKSLRQIDETINASLDLGVTIRILLGQITSQLKVDAAAILISDPKTARLKYMDGWGFNKFLPRNSDFLLEQGLAVRTAQERHIIHISDQDLQNTHSPMMNEEHFVEYYGVPLISKGNLKGVLEIFHRSPLFIDEAWLDFMGTLAGQAAIAIDDIGMFENLQRSNMELTLAYDATIEGWSQAMDLRDKETEGHTRRVTEMTQQLARAFGLPEETLVHIRRGSLLHDIGKLGVPDHILLKPGPLDDSEWIVMKRHPDYAYQMLAPIEYLRPALDIPFCHHEKWDGSGYPQGLKGEDIPLAARIFSIIDTWDALTSDRPYRPAWTKDETLAYIKELDGIQFDPMVVEAFIRFLSK